MKPASIARAADGFYRRPTRWKLMTAFESILFEHGEDESAACPTPACFRDLHLDEIVTDLTAGRAEYELAPFFHHPLRDLDAVRYRHEIVSDLQHDEVHSAAHEFSASLREMRACLSLAGELYEPLQQERWFLAAVAGYCAAVDRLSERLTALTLSSRGLLALRAYLSDYTGSEAFRILRSDTDEREAELAVVSYVVQIRGKRVRVGRSEGEIDMSERVQEVFARFGQRSAARARLTYRDNPHLNHVEVQILELVARLHPDTFEALRLYCERHAGYLDARIARFDREVQFYLAYLHYIAPLRSRGLSFTLPRVCTRSKQESATAAFDLALAAKLAHHDATVVTNDFRLDGDERVLVVSGPNNGGKTTFARLFGQLHHLAGLGLPVPGADVRLFLADRIFTHFEREEDVATLRGKLEDELVRVREILAQATGDSVVVMNESFGSTTLRDALTVGTAVLDQLIDLGVLAVFVTFVDELASLGSETVSMMSTVDAQDPAVRTFKVVRKPADGMAYAAALAEKYGLGYETLRRRVMR